MPCDNINCIQMLSLRHKWPLAVSEVRTGLGGFRNWGSFIYCHNSLQATGRELWYRLPNFIQSNYMGSSLVLWFKFELRRNTNSCIYIYVTIVQPWTEHSGQYKMVDIVQTFSSAFSWMKIYEFRLVFHWSLFTRVKLTIFQHWFG